MIYAAILAGGTGTRMGGELPKQFMRVGPTPILVRSVSAFLNCGIVFGGIYVAAAAEHIERTRSLMDISFGEGRVTVIEGGTDRAGSLLNVINAVLENGGSEDDILITHDAARPFVTADIIRRNIEDTAAVGCAGTAIPAVDTILRSADGCNIDSIPPRSEMYHMQTPQGFGIGRYLSCYNSLSAEDKAAVTDACGVFLRAGQPVRFTMGIPENIKITVPLDIVIGDHIAENFDN